MTGPLPISPATDDGQDMNEPTWDLDFLYAGPDDPRLLADQDHLVDLYRRFDQNHRGRLTETLGAALADLEEIQRLGNRLHLFLDLRHAADLGDEAVLGRLHGLRPVLDAAFGEHGVFFVDEVARMEETDLQRLVAADRRCARLKPYLEQLRRLRPHLLAPAVEGALTKRGAFGPDSWTRYFDQARAALRFDVDGRAATLTDMLHDLSASPDAAHRAATLAALNAGLDGPFLQLSAQTLNMVIGGQRVEDRERGYPHPMAARNLGNRVDDAMVTALHRAVEEQVVPLAQRYYRLKGRLLGITPLNWSDRAAPLLLDGEPARTPFAEALALVTDAFGNISPVLAGIIRDELGRGRIDATPRPGKQSGAFNYSVTLPGDGTVSFVLLNYRGTPRDVMTLAHELGHAVHGILAGRAQGPLLAAAPMAYAETASLFGEMAAFQVLLERERAAGRPGALLTLLMDKIGELLDTVLRQIGFSWFEQRLHNAGRHLSAEGINALWMESLETFYGPDGAVFRYRNADRLWSTISHFHAPFYVYAYAFGALLTQSLFAVRDDLGERFETLYLEMLRSGGARDVRALLAPFGLDPGAETFWEKGIASGLAALIDEVERLTISTHGT